ncbi:MAG TPA: N-acetylmuramoyl-L-alanine amidase, partial [Symbiobacteriaceae bacterium]|nr:N-acetylmuramoyl-L-alanine amidase [Symbiobacteriaceae bacterium]
NANTGVREKEINLQVALRLRAILAARGANVLLTRVTDGRVAPPEVFQLGPADDQAHVDMGWRTYMANQLKVDLFFSIHHNCCEGSGTETYYTATTLNGDRSRTMARILQQELAPGLGQVDRGALADLMYVTRTTEAPAVLLELAFINHRVEQHLVSRPDYQEQAAVLMARAIERFFAERTD